jgi:hypothetical protein
MAYHKFIIVSYLLLLDYWEDFTCEKLNAMNMNVINITYSGIEGIYSQQVLRIHF